MDINLSNEWGRLAKGNVNGVRSTDTFEFIFKYKVPNNGDIIYITYALDHRPFKRTIQVQIIVGGNRLNYIDDTGSLASNLLETKVFINSTISDINKGAKLVTADIKDYFLATPVDKPNYMKV